MTGGPKATRVRRVFSVSDGPVEVGYAPTHSAPIVRDNPLVMIQVGMDGEARKQHRICFTVEEAEELCASLAWVLHGDGDPMKRIV